MKEYFSIVWQRVKNFFPNCYTAIKKNIVDDISDTKRFFKDPHDIKDGFAEILYDGRHVCLHCDEELFEDEIFCDKCRKLFPLIDGETCPRCGRQMPTKGSCNVCKLTQHSFDRAFSVFNYEGEIARYILLMKEYDKDYLHKPLAQYLVYKYMRCDISVDMVTFVPMTNQKEKRKGWNHSKSLAEEFSYITGIPVFYGVSKKRETAIQKRLNAQERRENLKGVFAVKGDVKGKKILIIDDVLTTGSTIDSLAKSFKLKNSSRIYGITVASTGERFTKEKK